MGIVGSFFFKLSNTWQYSFNHDKSAEWLDCYLIDHRVAFTVMSDILPNDPTLIAAVKCLANTEYVRLKEKACQN
jgi:hypothetical protein